MLVGYNVEKTNAVAGVVHLNEATQAQKAADLLVTFFENSPT